MNKPHNGESNTKVPVASGRGESGRESVGDGVPTAKLLLLLLRALPGERQTKTKNSRVRRFASEKRNHLRHVSFISTINSRLWFSRANL